MRSTTTAVALAALSSFAFAAKDERTFAVNHFYGDPSPLTMGRMDPIVSPGVASQHVHAIHGGSNFGLTMDNTILMDSNCTSSLVKKDNSNYWTPALYFEASNGSFISVDFFYMNVYYFFEPTDDEVKAFPIGLRMMSGNNSARTPPATGGKSILDAAEGPAQPIQWTCPRADYDVPAYPADSDGLHGHGMADPNNKGAGVGFPDVNCDAFASPLRADIHFPSCYNPKADLRDYENNMAWPSSKGTTGGKANCPEGYIHTPHLFYEVYWDTLAFKDQWTPGKDKQPFILANGDRTGYSLHGDFIAGWDTDVLQNIIDNCNGGDSGMEACSSDITGPLNDPADTCNIANLIPEPISGVLDKLPGNNPPTGWGDGVDTSPSGTTLSIPGVSVTLGGSGSSTTASSSAPTSAPASPTSAPAPSQSTGTTTSSATGTSSPSVSSSNGAPEGWAYHGCYSDDVSQRALTGVKFANLGVGKVTSTGCVEYCEKAGFSVAGTEYAGQCFCGNSLNDSSKLADDKCDMKCSGDDSQTCGGSSALSVWQKSSSATKRSRAHFLKHLHGVHAS